jgi:subtilisin family serine protease
VIREVRRRRATKEPRDDVLQFDLWRKENRDRLPIVVGELLLRSTAHPKVIAAVERFVGVRAEEVEDLPGLIRLRNPKVPVARLIEIAAVVRRWNHQASVAYVTPLRPLLKGRGGAEPTAVDEEYRLEPSTSSPEARVRVAVIDSGVAEAPRTDGWLAGVADAAGTDAIDPLNVFPLEPKPDDFLDFGAGHGSFVAGVVQQVAPDAAVSMFRAIDSDGVGSEVAVGQAMVRAVRDHGAKVINLSLGIQTADDQPLLAVEVALENIHEIDPEVLVVAAAGNYGDTVPCFPGAQKGVVGVAALTPDMKPAPWSTRGFWVTCSTVGEGICSTYVVGKESPILDPDPDEWEAPNPWAVWSGTSFAAPQIAGEVARRMAADGQTPREALEALLDTGRRIPDVGHAVRIMPGTGS